MLCPGDHLAEAHPQVRKGRAYEAEAPGETGRTSVHDGFLICGADFEPTLRISTVRSACQGALVELTMRRRRPYR